MPELGGGFGICQRHDAKFVKKLHGEFQAAKAMAAFRRGADVKEI
jgi:hypothetical protein